MENIRRIKIHDRSIQIYLSKRKLAYHLLFTLHKRTFTTLKSARNKATNQRPCYS